MHCHECFHCSACGQSSQYNDASQCKNYIRTCDLVPIDVFNQLRDTCSDLGTKVESLKSEIKHKDFLLNDAMREMHDLKIIKQTLEMSSGLKFDF